MKISSGEITIAKVIPTAKLVLKLLKDSINGNMETKTKTCKITPSKTFNNDFEYGLNI